MCVCVLAQKKKKKKNSSVFLIDESEFKTRAHNLYAQESCLRSTRNPVSSVWKSARLLTVWSWVQSPSWLLSFDSCHISMGRPKRCMARNCCWLTVLRDWGERVGAVILLLLGHRAPGAASRLLSIVLKSQSQCALCAPCARTL